MEVFRFGPLESPSILAQCHPLCKKPWGDFGSAFKFDNQINSVVRGSFFQAQALAKTIFHHSTILENMILIPLSFTTVTPCALESASFHFSAVVCAELRCQVLQAGAYSPLCLISHLQFILFLQDHPRRQTVTSLAPICETALPQESSLPY